MTISSMEGFTFYNLENSIYNINYDLILFKKKKNLKNLPSREANFTFVRIQTQIYLYVCACVVRVVTNMCVCTNKTYTLWRVIRRRTATINKSLLHAYYYVLYVGLVWYTYGEKAVTDKIMHLGATVNYLTVKKKKKRQRQRRVSVYRWVGALHTRSYTRKCL